MSNVKSQQSSLNQSNGAVGSSRAPRALAAAQQAAAQMRPKKIQKLRNSLSSLDHFESFDLVWMAHSDSLNRGSKKHDMHVDAHISLIERIDFCQSSILSWPSDPQECDEWDCGELEDSKKAIHQVVWDLKSSCLPFVFAAHIPHSNNLCFQFGHFDRQAAFNVLTDTIAYYIVQLSEELQRFSDKRYFPEQYVEDFLTKSGQAG